jgi:hypothetical protein
LVTGVTGVAAMVAGVAARIMFVRVVIARVTARVVVIGIMVTRVAAQGHVCWGHRKVHSKGRVAGL